MLWIPITVGENMVRDVIEGCCQDKEDEHGKKDFASTRSLVILIRVVSVL